MPWSRVTTVRSGCLNLHFPTSYADFSISGSANIGYRCCVVSRSRYKTLGHTAKFWGIQMFVSGFRNCFIVSAQLYETHRCWKIRWSLFAFVHGRSKVGHTPIVGLCNEKAKTYNGRSRHQKCRTTFLLSLNATTLKHIWEGGGGAILKLPSAFCPGVTSHNLCNEASFWVLYITLSRIGVSAECGYLVRPYL